MAMTRQVIVAFAVVVMLAAGCGSEAPPEAFTERPPLDVCGAVRYPYTESAAEDAEACLRRAVSQGDGAELQVTFTGVEGGETIRFLRTLPGGGFEVFYDSTGMDETWAGWSHRRCEPLDPAVLEGVGCVPVGEDG